MRAVLTQRNFALLWAAALISLLGDQVLSTALVFFVYRLTGSVLATGTITVAYFLPVALLGSVAGVFVDRWNLKPTILITNLAQAAMLLPLLLLRSPGQVWFADVLALGLSVLSLFAGPATSILLPRLVDEKRLVAANSLNSMSSNLTRLLGPPLGGALLVWGGMPVVTELDSLSFVAAAVLVALIAFPPRPAPPPADERAHGVMSAWMARWRDWLEGLQIIRRQRSLAVVFLVGGIATVGDAMLGPLLAPFVRDLLHSSALIYGWISVATGLGGLLGAAVVGRIRSRLGPMGMVSVGLIGVGLLALVRYNVVILPAALITFFVGGLGAAIWNIGRTTLLQSETPDSYRGRVFGASGTTTALALLAGSSLASILGDRVGILPLLEVSAALYLAAGLLAPALAAARLDRRTQLGDESTASDLPRDMPGG